VCLESGKPNTMVAATWPSVPNLKDDRCFLETAVVPSEIMPGIKMTNIS
jgi:hypothetical protein